MKIQRWLEKVTVSHRGVMNLFRPGRVFLVLSIFFGLLWLVLTPPFQAPDETRHFCRAYQISDGHIFPLKLNNTAGDSLPKSVIETMEQINPGLKFHSKDQRQDINKVKYYLRYPLKPLEKEFYAFPNSAIYPPTAYLPQVIGILVGKAFAASPLVLMYLGRFCNLVFWLIFVSLALRLLAGSRWLFATIALMPMSVFLSASLNQDPVINALIYFYIAYLYHLSRQELPLSKKSLAIVFILNLVIAFSKPLYAIFCFLFFILPKNSFTRRRNYYFYFAGLIIASYAITLLWNSLVAVDLNWNKPWACFDDQVSLVKAKPWIFILAAVRSFWTFKFLYLRSHIGQLGWLDTVLPLWIIGSFLLLLIVFAFFENGLRLSRWQKAIFLFIILAVSSQTMLSLYLVNSPVGSLTVHGIQGRYFLPLAPLFWLLWHSRKSRPAELWPAAVSMVISLIMFLALIGTTWVLIGRYYL